MKKFLLITAFTASLGAALPALAHDHDHDCKTMQTSGAPKCDAKDGMPMDNSKGMSGMGNMSADKPSMPMGGMPTGGMPMGGDGKNMGNMGSGMKNMPMDTMPMDKSGMMTGGDQQMKMLTASDPADGATVKTSPRALTLTFMHPVLVDTVSVTGPDGKPVKATFKRPQAASATYKVALPRLKSGAYAVTWSASGMGHSMQGDLHFTVQ